MLSPRRKFKSHDFGHSCQSGAQAVDCLGFQLMYPRYGNLNSFSNFRKIEFFQKVQLYDQLQPIRKIGNRYCKTFAKFFIGKNCKGIGTIIGKGRVAVGVGFIEGLEADRLGRLPQSL